MNISAFSLMMSILWFSIFIIIISLAMKNNYVITNFSIKPLLLLFIVCVLRLLCIFELPFTIIIPSESIFTFIIDFFTTPISSVLNSNIPLSFFDIFVLIWLCGSIYFIAKYIFQFICLRRTIRITPGTKNPFINSCMNKVLYKYHKNIHVKIIQSDKIIVPMVTGFLSPTIYLPNIYLSETELTNILQHELTHFLHKDAWTKLFVYLICSAFWWNPFVHTLKSNLNHLLEIRCDLSVTSKMCAKERINYLNSIQRIIEHKLSADKANAHDNLSMVSVLVSTSSTKKIEQRFGLVLAKQSKNHTFAKYVIYIMLFILFLFSQIFIIQPQYAPLITRGYEETFSITPQTAYLTINNDDTYSLYTIDGQYRCNISDITKEPFSKLPINE